MRNGAQTELEDQAAAASSTISSQVANAASLASSAATLSTSAAAVSSKLSDAITSRPVSSWRFSPSIRVVDGVQRQSALPSHCARPTPFIPLSHPCEESMPLPPFPDAAIDLKRVLNEWVDARHLLDYVLRRDVPPASMPSPPVENGNVPFAWSRNICHLMQAFFEPLFAALVASGFAKHIAARQIARPSDSLAHILGKCIAARMDGASADRESQLHALWKAASDQHVSTIHGGYGSFLTWWDLLRAADFGDTTLRNLCCWKVHPTIRCQSPLCPRNRMELVEYVPYIRVSPMEADVSNRRKSNFQTMLQVAVDKIQDSTLLDDEERVCHLSWAEVECRPNPQTVKYRECLGTTQPVATPVRITPPQVLTALIPPVNFGTATLEVPARVNIRIGDNCHTYRPVAFVYKELARSLLLVG